MPVLVSDYTSRASRYLPLQLFLYGERSIFFSVLPTHTTSPRRKELAARLGSCTEIHEVPTGDLLTGGCLAR